MSAFVGSQAMARRVFELIGGRNDEDPRFRTNPDRVRTLAGR